MAEPDSELVEIRRRRNQVTRLAVKAYMGMSDYYATDDGERNDLALGAAYLIADLMHLAETEALENIHWEDLLSWAGEHYGAETEETG